jgi:curved DNA-binding protein CbpA
MSRNVPNWNLLPNNPLEFFGLAPGFDRKELKRAYGKLIKQFKPESHPAEFQKIREAYEVLESQNRYGVQQALMSQLSSAWNITTDRNIPHASNTDQESVAAEVVNDFDAAIAQPLATYKRLARGSNRSPQDFYILATLSDLVDSHSENMYVKWLLTGVNEHPGDPGLLRLLTEYLAAFAESNIACSTLLTLSKLIEGSDFYRVTERLWDRLLDELPFATFSKTRRL